MTDPVFNKYRTAIEILQRGRDLLVEGLADEIIDQGDDLTEGGYAFNEFLETQGTRLHFLSLLLGQLEQSAEALIEAEAARPGPKAAPKRRARPRKVQGQASKKEPSDES